jgi:DNA-binding CsgD family transcriptional regulator
MFAGDFAQTDQMLTEASALAEQWDDDLLRARIAECRGHALLYQGDLPTAVARLEDSRARYRRLGEPLGEFDTLVLLTAATFFLEDPRDGEFSRQALALAEHHGALSSKAYALWCVGIVRWRAGEYGPATEALRECVRLFQPLHDLTGISFGVQALSWCAASVSPDERAARLLGASQAVWRTSGAKVDETNAYNNFDQLSRDTVREAIGTASLEKALAEGASYSWEQAVALALGQDRHAPSSDEPSPTGLRPGTPGGLTRRELEIALLLAEGLSNKDIAARLVISQRTAESHVDRILSKLGFTSRYLVASWVAEQQAR